MHKIILLLLILIVKIGFCNNNTVLSFSGIFGYSYRVYDDMIISSEMIGVGADINYSIKFIKPKMNIDFEVFDNYTIIEVSPVLLFVLNRDIFSPGFGIGPRFRKYINTWYLKDLVKSLIWILYGNIYKNFKIELEYSRNKFWDIKARLGYIFQL